jgi:hypothetical protein
MLEEDYMHLHGIAQRGESKLLYPSKAGSTRREGGMDERDAAMLQQ